MLQYHLETKMRDINFIIKNNETCDDINKSPRKTSSDENTFGNM